jgi:hypothetical protein
MDSLIEDECLEGIDGRVQNAVMTSMITTLRNSNLTPHDCFILICSSSLASHLISPYSTTSAGQQQHDSKHYIYGNDNQPF